MATENDIQNNVESALRHLHDKINIIKERVEKLCEETTGCIETLYGIENNDENNSTKEGKK